MQDGLANQWGFRRHQRFDHANLLGAGSEIAAAFSERQFLQTIECEKGGCILDRALHVGQKDIARCQNLLAAWADQLHHAEAPRAFDGKNIEPPVAQLEILQRASGERRVFRDAQPILAIRQVVELDPVLQPRALHNRRGADSR